MIRPSTDNRLAILLPSTNKALAEAVRHATPEQLELLQKGGKDIKTVLDTLFREKIGASKSDQVLMEILKNAPVFKNMGNFSEALKTVAAEFKTVPELARKSPLLEHFLKNFASLSGESLKSQMAQSGVFMESKIASALQSLPSLKETLQNLHTLLIQSTRPEARTLGNTVASLLKQPIWQEGGATPSGAREISAAVQKIAESLRTLGTSVDPLHSKEVAQLAKTVESASLLLAQDAKPALSQLYGILLSSTDPQSNLLLDGIEKLLQSKTLSETDLKAFSQQLGAALEHSDPIKAAASLLPQLTPFGDPDTLDLDLLLHKVLQEDLKSQLLGLSEELQNSTHPKAEQLLEHVDRLLGVIDYHQLVSYLDASNSIYFPFSWDLLEEGSLAFKKGKEHKFYCEINLLLKEYGELNLMMALYEGNQLDIQAHAQSREFQEQLSENLPQLRALLIDAGLIPNTIRISLMRDTAPYEEENYGSQGSGSDLGFEVKV